MTLFFGGYNIRPEHISAVSSMADLGSQQLRGRFTVQVLLVGGQTLQAAFDDEGLAMKTQLEAKTAAGFI
ncbi:hypothetical protein U2S91_16745 [Stenotrophomonas maltophilia]|nr:hypothetical protein [Stenotrophomonas maltophilia]WQI19778.1 hypothetical protein U2S91_16745 [Stenotrophomonas maltophilia]